jgi:seryl-tRNA synthetase
VLYTGLGARLQRALFTFMIDHQTTRNGYREVYPPYIVNRASLVGTGNLPKFEEELYQVGEDMFLIPTAEVPVTNIYRDETLSGDDLPIKFAAYSACFRSEAGAAGKDTRGVLRIHQFDKVELVKFVKPEDSYEELERLVNDAESILQALGLHYRIIELCSGDLSEKGSKCYDLELWAPGVERYLEISSCSNFEAYQSRRANIRFRRAQGDKPEFVHILNGSGLACPRLFASVLETFYQPDGTVVVPEALRPYVGVDRIA